MSLSDKAQATRQRILESATALFHRNGYNATGLDKIITAAGVTKGNFYYYFKSKEELAVATLDWQFKLIWQDLDEQVMQRYSSPRAQLLGIARYMLDAQRQDQANGIAPGCYFGNFALELSTVSQPIKDKVRSIFQNIESVFHKLLDIAKSQDEIANTINPDMASTIILSQLEGSVLLNKTDQQSRILDNTMNFIEHYLDHG